MCCKVHAKRPGVMGRHFEATHMCTMWVGKKSRDRRLATWGTNGHVRSAIQDLKFSGHKLIMRLSGEANTKVLEVLVCYACSKRN